MYDNRFTIVK